MLFIHIVHKLKKNIMFTKILTMSLLILYVTAIDNCNILSLSGGGSFGAVEAGILKDLVDKNKINSTFDMITGISAGGLNTAFLSYDNNLSNSIDSLIDIYQKLNTKSIYSKNSIRDIYKEWGFYDTTPLENTIIDVLRTIVKQDNSTIPISLIGASNLNLEKLDIFRYDLADFDNKINILMATSAIPLLFPPRKIDEYTYVDGGAIDNEIIYQAMGFINCNFYNFTFVSASDKSVDYQSINSYKDYIHGVYKLVVNTFDYELAGLQNITCSLPRGNINICLPQAEMLEDYSILDFDHGKELVDIGRNYYTCDQVPLC